jgi:hypothetical protein
MAEVSEATMPQCSGGSGGGEGTTRGGWRRERVEVAAAIAPDDLVPSSKILHRKTKGVKLN